MGGQKQFFKRRRDAKTKEQIERDAASVPGFALQHGEHPHTSSFGL
jgi:hypothetical protein